MVAPVEQVARPSSRLARFVAETRVWMRGDTEAPQRVEQLPDGSTMLLFRATEAGRGALLRGDVSVAGPRTRARFKSVKPGPLSIGLTFKPGAAYPFFGVPVHALVDRNVLL